MAGMVSGIEEEDGVTAANGSVSGGGAPSVWRKTMARVWLGRQ
jgi:hypothetical protein